MLTLHDAAALSVWPKARMPRVGEFLRSLAPETSGGADTLLAALEFAGVTPPDGLAATLRDAAALALARAERAGIVPVPFGDSRYPPLLALIPDPPAVLWLRGRVADLRRPAVALVGSRSPSAYGTEAALSLAADLAAAGVTIVSGLARGIDSAAHRGALQAEGSTVAVLGSGPDEIYPPEHGALADSIAGSGAVVSELPPGTPPRALHFPARNRIISGLSLAVVVVEAAEQSGSLITAGCAVEQGRDVLAVPGSIFSGRQAGCHALIRDGAGVAASAADVLWAVRTSQLFGLAGEPDEARPRRDALLESMAPGEACDLDSLSRNSGLPAAVLLARLLELELQGAVRRVAGTRFVRINRTC
jgi:DNA processing protein